jgi:hypothetical protein
MCQEEASMISSFLFAISIAVGAMGVVFFKTWNDDRKKELKI